MPEVAAGNNGRRSCRYRKENGEPCRAAPLRDEEFEARYEVVERAFRALVESSASLR